MDVRPKNDLRHEIKFLINRAQQVALIDELSAQMQPDAHGEGGQYLVSSLYYDTADYKAYWDKVDGFDFRRKVRMRLYGNEPVLPESIVYLEIKARVGNRMAKRRLRLTHAEALVLTGQEEAPAAVIPTVRNDAEQQVYEELEYLFSALRLQATSVVSYQRLAYGGHEQYPDLRVTFDTAVRGRIDNLSLLSADAGSSHTILAPGWAILEVKVNQTMPFWLGELLSRHRCVPRRVSKYCAVLERCGTIRRRQHIFL
ncbi:MAG: polyphosphate polymerase domain-containing protein [Caldilineaceae bacterium]|nr:polyphosphate polymerase domain-containing protein [Caldilineaceae bacterium]